jgi:hypothetical protein
VIENKTALEERLEERIAAEEPAPERVYVENWSSCSHSDVRYLGSIGAASLTECQTCGMTTGVAK